MPKESYRFALRLSDRDERQKSILQMLKFLKDSGEYATESEILREGICSLYKEKTEGSKLVACDRIEELLMKASDDIVSRIEKTITEAGIQKEVISVPVADEDMSIVPESTETSPEYIDDFLNVLGM